MQQAVLQVTTEKDKAGPPIPAWLAKIILYEYWPVWAFYLPFSFYWLFLSIRLRSLTYYTAVNPGIEMSGFWGNSKSAVLKKIPEEFLPVTVYVSAEDKPEDVLKPVQDAGIHFPLICKPDKGERGYKVEKINNASELNAYLKQATGKLIIQEFIMHPLELGILYYKLPDGSKSGITSVVKKEFMTVTGDGVSTITALMNKSLRTRLQLEATQQKLGEKMNSIPVAGEEVLLEPIGNHCRGTAFINGNALINPQLLSVIENIASRIEGFHYGRFDLKVKSLEDLYAGKTIKIMELNGVTSEPAHIYGSDMNIFKAANSVILHSNLLFKIAKQNRKRGIKPYPFFQFVRHLLAYRSSLRSIKA